MLIGSLHPLADLGNVGKDGLLVTFTQALRRWNLVTPGTTGSMVGVLLCEEGKES